MRLSVVDEEDRCNCPLVNLVGCKKTVFCVGACNRILSK